MSGSFWKFSNGFTSLSNVLTLLEQYNANRHETDSEDKLNDDDNEKYNDEHSTEAVLLRLLDESDLLQELLSNNSMLLEFLRDEKVLGLLVDLVVNEDNVAEKGVQEKKDEEMEKEKEKQEGEEDEDEEKMEMEEVEDEKKEDEEKHKDEDEEDDDDEGEKEGDSDVSQSDASDTSGKDDDEEDEDNETEEERNTRHATLSAEILAADVWSLTDTVMESTSSLNTLWSILDTTKPLSINLSTYFMKIMEHLLDMKCDEMITYLIDNQPNLVLKFMNHLSNPPLMDFLLKLISTDKPDNSTGIIDFLQNQKLINHLIQSLDITESNLEIGEALLRQSSAADFLKALITISANSTTDNSSIGPNELTRELVSFDQMNMLCDIMLKGDYALANGVGIIIEIIRKNNSDYDLLPVLYITLESHPPTGRDPIYLGHLLKVFGEKIKEFNKLLLKSPKSNVGAPNDLKNGLLKTPFGEIEPLGFERFKICELIAELLHCSNMALLNDNKGFDIVNERDNLRIKMKEYDPISFKYNEVIVLPSDFEKNDENNKSEDVSSDLKKLKVNEDQDQDLEFANDTVDSFNSKDDDDEVDIDEDDINTTKDEDEDEEDEGIDEETHANANLTEAQIRAKPVIGDFLKVSLYDTQIISNILSMFFKFPWNNFLHNVVFDIVQQVLNGSMDIGFNKFLAMDLFDRGDITNKIIKGQNDCTDYEANNNGLRLGYMGHLTLIAEEVVKFIQLYPVNSLSELIDVKVEDEVWEEYVRHVLYDTREKYNAILGGGEDDDDDDDDEEASNTFDEGVGEILEDDKPKSNGLVFNLSVDHDIIGSGYEDKNDDEEDDDEEEQVHKSHGMSSSSDESESEEDDDHFSNYMSQQLTNTNNSDANKLPSPTTKLSDDEDEESSEEENEYIRGKLPELTKSKSKSPAQEEVIADEDDDAYIDPNDDGLSYKKSAHPLYDSNGHLINVDDEDLSEDSSSSSENEEDDDDLSSGSKDSGNKLTRASSKS